MPSIKPDELEFDDRWILDHRGSRNIVDPGRPYAYLVEPERQSDGTVEDVATVFLTNKECPLHCLMCDLWKNTTEERIPDGAIVSQVEWALSQLPRVRHLKLYNSGSFFDKQAIPQADWSPLAMMLQDYESVVVETHPRTVINQAFVAFSDMLEGDLQVAMGLETVDPEVLPLLNKKMDLGHFEAATSLLLKTGIGVRAFILLRTPFQNEKEGLDWAKRSLDFAFSIGVECCVLIPTRAGNGAMDWLQAQGHFSTPSLSSLEEALDYGVGLKRGRVFADLWDVEKFFDCPECGPERAERIRQVNLSQEVLPRIGCGKCDC